MEWTPRPLVEHLREQERHNVTVITVGSKYEVYVRSPASSHMQTLKQPFQTLAIKWEVNIFLKKSFLRLYHAFSFLRLYRCVAVDDYITVASCSAVLLPLPKEILHSYIISNIPNTNICTHDFNYSYLILIIFKLIYSALQWNHNRYKDFGWKSCL